MEKDKINGAYGYFKNEFPGCSIEGNAEDERIGQTFVITCGGSDYSVTLSQSFLDDRNANDVADSLRLFSVAEHLRLMGTVPLLVETDGVEMTS